MTDRKHVDALSRRLADEGKLIEAGWVTMRLLVLPPDIGADQLNDMRMAFMAGAQHLFGSIMAILDPGEDETPGDLRRMELISDELEAFAKELLFRLDPGRGSA